MSVPANTLLERLLLQSTTEVFDAWSISDARPVGVGRWGAASGAPELAGIARIGGARLRGAVVIAGPFAFFARTRPNRLRVSLDPRRAGDWLLARDWAGEMANQLRGRIVNRLSPFGWDLELHHASALSGETLVHYAPHSTRSAPVVFTAGNDRVWVWLDVERDAEPEAKAPSRPAAIAAREGEILIF